MNQYIRVTAFALCFFVCSSFLCAESFRTRKTHLAAISAPMQAQTPTQKCSLGFNDVLAVTLPPKESRLFLQGVELEIKVPSEMLTFRHCIAYSFYKNITGEPTADTIDYDGDCVFIETVPPRLSMVLQIPLSNTHEIEKSPYATIMESEVIPEDNLIFLRLQPIMKGLPDNVELITFDVTVKPILSNQGLLDLKIRYPEAEQKGVSVFIDEQPVTDYTSPLILTEGIHYLALTSENYRSEVRTFTIEKAQTTHLELALLDSSPAIVISAPENAAVYLNDEPITVSKEPIIVKSGEYTVKFVVGDYEVSKTISVVNGKTYNVSLTVDVQLSETP